jgi:hypothetical protein
MRTLLITLLTCLALGVVDVRAQDVPKNRLIVLTDIEADPDDTQSLVRLMLYSNVIDIEGLIATTSTWKRTSISPGSIERIVRAYGEVRENLLLHEKGFPAVETLMSKIKSGIPEYGMTGVGDGKDSEGSDWIIRALEKDDDRPLWISTWGGVNTLAQALYTLRQTRPVPEVAEMVSRLRVYTISDQDDSGAWIREQFPELFYIVSPGDDYGSATWIAINSVIAGIDNTTISNDWLAENIQQGHGPLGAAYPDVAWGVEGDTPAFLSLIPNGLNEPDRPDWGGWGGRYRLYSPDYKSLKQGGSGVPLVPMTRDIWTDTVERYAPYVPSEFGRTIRRADTVFASNKASLWRWRDDFQNDFAARMDWSEASYAEANHPPVPVLGTPERITVKSGDGFGLDASGSYDPDGDNLGFLWFHYPEAGSYPELIPVAGAENAHRAWIVAPEVSEEQTAHFILRLTDKGSPPLSRYRRVLVTIEQ